MIHCIYIDSYRSVRNISLDLDRFNIIFGPNGCGKSNIYKAINLLSGAASGQGSRIQYGRAQMAQIKKHEEFVCPVKQMILNMNYR